MGFSRQEYQTGLSLLTQGLNPLLYPPALAGRIFTTTFIFSVLTLCLLYNLASCTCLLCRLISPKHKGHFLKILSQAPLCSFNNLPGHLSTCRHSTSYLISPSRRPARTAKSPCPTPTSYLFLSAPLNLSTFHLCSTSQPSHLHLQPVVPREEESIYLPRTKVPPVISHLYLLCSLSTGQCTSHGHCQNMLLLVSTPQVFLMYTVMLEKQFLNTSLDQVWHLRYSTQHFSNCSVWRTFLMVQWLRLFTFIAGGMGLIPGWRTKEASQIALAIKNPPTNAGRCNNIGSIPGLGRSFGGGNGNSLQYSGLENPMDRGAQQATVHSVTESDTTEVTQHAPNQGTKILHAKGYSQKQTIVCM